MSATSLSRERIAEIRADAEAGHWVRHDPALILALLDAYEALIPRPASEPPEPEVEVLVKLRGQNERRTGYHDGSSPGGTGHAWATEGDWHMDDEIECWWPLPPLPKGGADE